jgi:hypothetical protein
VPAKSSLIETIKEKLERLTSIQDDGCWMFLGPWNSHGYGHLTYDGKVYRAHRASYIIYVGSIPEGLNVLHRCDNRYCVNPEHLFLGTLADNALDMRAKGRDTYGQNFGVNNGQAVLKEHEVLQIMGLLEEGNLTQDEIGRLFGVSRGAVKQIKLGKTWTYLRKVA